jgi:FkbM family methyltransferase
MLIPLELARTAQRQKARLTGSKDGGFLLADGAGRGQQTVAFLHPELQRARLRLRARLRPQEGASADFCLLHDGGKLLARVAPDGTLSAASGPELLEARCEEDGSGAFHLDLHFRNFSPALQFGLGKPGTRYSGTDAPQFALHDVQVEVTERRWLPSPADGLVVLQAGAKPDPAWAPHQDSLRVILCEADEAAGQAALAALPAPERHVLLASTLSNRNGAARFHITRDGARSSLFDPDLRRVKPFASAAGFDVTGETKLPLARYDTLSRQRQLPTPDLVRIRAAGSEYDVLRGCGDILDRVLAVEVQVHLYPLYRKQKLFGDVVDLLDGCGLALRRLVPEPVAETAHEMAVATAFLTRRKAEGAALDRLAFIEEIWGVSWPR